MDQCTVILLTSFLERKYFLFLFGQDIFKRSALSEIFLCPPCVQSSQGGGHRTLLYGHAILLRHNHSGMVRLLCTLFKE